MVVAVYDEGDERFEQSRRRHCVVVRALEPAVHGLFHEKKALVLQKPVGVGRERRIEPVKVFVRLRTYFSLSRKTETLI